MTSKQLVLDAIKYKTVPRIPVCVLDGYNWILKRLGITQEILFSMDVDKASDLILDSYNLIESDIVYANAYAVKALRDTTSSFNLEGPKDICSHSVKDVFSKTVSHDIWKSFIEQIESYNKKIGDEKLILAFGVGPLTSAGGTIGMENLMMALHESPDDMQYLLDFSVETTIRMINDQLDHGATAVSIADPVSSINMISDEYFEQYSLPGLKRIFAETKRPGIPIMLHICGNTTSRLSPLVGTGFDIFSLDSVNINDAFSLSKKDYAIFGNLNTVQIMLQASPDTVYQTAKSLCAEAGLGGGFILAPGCDLPPDTPLENIQAMVRAAKENSN